MNIRHTFMTIAAVLLTSAVFADSSSVTSKKYVDDFMAGYQNKIPGSGADKLMIYDDTDGISAKQIVSSLGDDTGATNIPDVGAVKDALNGKQDKFNGTAGYVMTGMGTNRPGEVGERAIYGTAVYSNSLVTAETVNTGVTNAVNSSLIRVDANGNPSDTGTLWEINTDLFALDVLPTEYTQLEWIESAGTQYIDTGLELFATTDPFLIDVDLSFADMSGRYLTGVSGSNPGYAGRSFDGTFEINGTYTTMTSGVNQRVNFQYGNIANQGNKIGIRVTKNGETEYKMTPFLFAVQNDKSWIIFGNNNNTNNPTPTRVLKGKIYQARAYKNNELKFNGIPASKVENSVTVVGLYDTVSGTFFRNAGTGNFTAGPPVAN